MKRKRIDGEYVNKIYLQDYTYTKGKIRFGVRRDGFLYADYGMIGGWVLTKDSLASYGDIKNAFRSTGTAEVLMELNATKATIQVKDAVKIDGLEKVIELGQLGAEEDMNDATVRINGSNILGGRINKF